MLVGRWAQEHLLERNRKSLLESSGAGNLTAKRVKDGVLEPVAAPEPVVAEPAAEGFAPDSLLESIEPEPAPAPRSRRPLPA